MKQKIIIIGTGLMGSTAASLFGGWDTALQTLVLFMAIDWFTGGILLPGVFKKSPKSASGALESHAGWKRAVQKGHDAIVRAHCGKAGSSDADAIYSGCRVHRIYSERIIIHRGECRTYGTAAAGWNKERNRY